jgi:Holliday junction resolvasome RuvABC endonuclease subunit
MIVGLDLSSTATGICVDGVTWTVAPKGTLLERARATRHMILDRVAMDHPRLVVMEAIGTRFVGTAIAIATVHALVLDSLDDWGVPILMVAPNQLKKWATGTGNADKTAMVTSAMRAGWDAPENCTDDQADAWHLWSIGCAVRGEPVVTMTGYRETLLAELRSAESPAPTPTP